MPPFWLQLWRVSTVTLWQGYGLGMSVFGSKIEWPLVRGVKLDWVGWLVYIVYIYIYILIICYLHAYVGLQWFTYIYWLFVYTDVGYLHAYRCWILTYIYIYVYWWIYKYCISLQCWIVCRYLGGLVHIYNCYFRSIAIARWFLWLVMFPSKCPSKWLKKNPFQNPAPSCQSAVPPK